MLHTSLIKELKVPYECGLRFQEAYSLQGTDTLLMAPGDAERASSFLHKESGTSTSPLAFVKRADHLGKFCPVAFPSSFLLFKYETG